MDSRLSLLKGEIMSKVKKTREFLMRFSFENSTRMVDDGVLLHCVFCGREAWFAKDVEHKKSCELGKVLAELDKVDG